MQKALLFIYIVCRVYWMYVVVRGENVDKNLVTVLNFVKSLGYGRSNSVIPWLS